MTIVTKKEFRVFSKFSHEQHVITNKLALKFYFGTLKVSRDNIFKNNVTQNKTIQKRQISIYNQ